MRKIFILLFPVVFFWGIFIYIVLTVPYPESLTQANLNQIIPLFASLYLAIAITVNVFLKNFLSSLSIALGVILLLVLMALNSLNIVTGILTLISIALLYSYFRKRQKSSLTKHTKMPKLTKQI